MGGKPSKGTPADRRLKENKHLPPRQVGPSNEMPTKNKPLVPERVQKRFQKGTMVYGND